jgi:hypothetical protein
MTAESLSQEVTATALDHDVEAGNEKSTSNTKQITATEEDALEGVSSKKSEGAEVSELDTSLPLNWSSRKKFFNMAIPSILCFVVYSIPTLSS